MAQTIRLHGGPWHGEVATVPDNRDHFHVLQPDRLAARDYSVFDEYGPPATVPIREGIYSRVRNTNDFEWDGWVTHE